MKKRVFIPIILSLCMLFSACAPVITATPTPITTPVPTPTPIIPNDDIISLSDYAELLEYNDRKAQNIRYETLRRLQGGYFYVEDEKCIYTTSLEIKNKISYVHIDASSTHLAIGPNLFYFLENGSYTDETLFDTCVSIYDLATLFDVPSIYSNTGIKYPDISDYPDTNDYQKALNEYYRTIFNDTNGTINYWKQIFNLAKAEFNWDDSFEDAIPLTEYELQEIYYIQMHSDITNCFNLTLTAKEIYALVQNQVFVGLSQSIDASYADTIDPELLMLMDLEDKTGITTYEVFVYLDISARDKDIEAIMSEAGISKSSWYKSYLDIPYYAPMKIVDTSPFATDKGSITATLTKEQIYALASNKAVGVIRPNMADKTLNSYSGDFDYIKESKIPTYLSESFYHLPSSIYNMGTLFKGDTPPKYIK